MVRRLRRNLRKKNLGKKSKRFYRRRRINKRPARSGQLVAYNNQLTNRVRASKTSLNVASYVGTAPGLVVNTVVNSLLSGMPDLAYYQALFAYYKMKSITYTFRWSDIDSTNTTTLSSVQQPTIYVCSNHDGNLTNANNLVEKKGVKSFTFTPEKTVFKYTIYPVTVSPVYYSNVASGYKKNPQCWIDVDYVSIPHYGMLLYIDNIPGGTQITRTETWNVDFKEGN